jgi:uncharacterized membrane protein
LEEGAAFCKSCGTPVSAATGTGPAQAPTTAGGISSNVAALLAYILGFVTGIIFLVIEPYNKDKFVRFHAFQSIFFCVAWIVFWIAWSVLAGVLGYFVGALAFILWGIELLIGLGFFLYWIFLMFKAYNNERYMVPFIGSLAAKQAG